MLDGNNGEAAAGISIAYEASRSNTLSDISKSVVKRHIRKPSGHLLPLMVLYCLSRKMADVALPSACWRRD